MICLLNKITLKTKFNDKCHIEDQGLKKIYIWSKNNLKIYINKKIYVTLINYIICDWYFLSYFYLLMLFSYNLLLIACNVNPYKYV